MLQEVENIRKFLITLLALFLMLFAYAQVSFASGFFGYQPEIPEALKK